MTHPTTTTGMGTTGTNTHMHTGHAHTTHTGGVGLEAQKAKVQVRIALSALTPARTASRSDGGLSCKQVASHIPGTVEHKVECFFKHAFFDVLM